MALDRLVTATRKDSRKNITHLCGAWGNVDVETAHREIKMRSVRYYVIGYNGREVDIHPYGDRFVRTDPDQLVPNNLDEMRDC